MSSPLDPALAPCAPVLREPAVARLAGDTLDWLRAEASFDGADARIPHLVTAASVFASLCAPVTATERNSRVAARFTLLFFLIDDAAPDELGVLLESRRPWSIGRHTPALAAWLADFHEMQGCSAALRGRFTYAYHGYLDARRQERAQKALPIGVEEHWAFRRRTIFMDPYVDQWMISIGIEPDEATQGRFADARRLATDIVLLSNDLGSVERDREGGDSPADLNLVDAYASERGWSRGETVDRLVELHNDLVRRYRDAVGGAEERAGGADAVRYADLLTSVVDGNLGALHALDFRYGGALAVIRRLLPVR